MPATFVVIGAMKSGTSTLREHLRTHPQVSMTKKDECDFFVEHRNWKRGLRWYESQFDMSRPARGDSSPNYTKHPVFKGVPERMYSVVPDAKLIYLMRDPIGRIISNYLHNLASGREERDLERALEGPATSGYVFTSLYFSQIQRFLACYKDNDILLLTLESLSSRPQEVLGRVFDHIGVDPSHEPESLGATFHKSSSKSRPTRLTRPLTKVPGGQVVRQLVARFLEPPIEKPAVSDALRQRLVDVIAPDVEALRAFSGMKLDEWSL